MTASKARAEYLGTNVALIIEVALVRNLLRVTREAREDRNAIWRRKARVGAHNLKMRDRERIVNRGCRHERIFGARI